MTALTTCVVNGCDRPIKARGLCGAHHQRWNKTGDTRPGEPLAVTVGRKKAISRSGLSGTMAYQKWKGMLKRCDDPKFHAYRYYGGKGVAVCAAWRDFSGFHEWLKSQGWVENRPAERRDWIVIDRIDPNGDYEPDNCVLTTYSENSKRTTHLKSKGSEPGTRWGDLVVIAPAAPLQAGKKQVMAVLCRCFCGREFTTRLSGLRRQDVRSCGCARAESNRRRNRRSAADDSLITPKEAS